MNYTNFKALITARAIPWFYQDLPDRYAFKSYEGPLAFDCVIFKENAAAGGFCSVTHAGYIADFETNYKAGAINIS